MSALKLGGINEFPPQSINEGIVVEYGHFVAPGDDRTRWKWRRFQLPVFPAL
jgi:hypothetical protein